MWIEGIYITGKGIENAKMSRSQEAGAVMTRADLIALLLEQAGSLRDQGVESLVLIGVPAQGALQPGQSVELLAGLRPPVQYADLQAMRARLSGALGRRVDLTLVDTAQAGVRDYLGAEAVRIL